MPSTKKYGRQDRHLDFHSAILTKALIVLSIIPGLDALHHMKQPPLVYVNPRSDNRPLHVTNQCPEVIYPAIGTQAGTAPEVQGFRLGQGETRKLSVSADWQGRVWGRTNCSFNADGTGPSNRGGNNGGGSACTTGDCGGIVNCRGTGMTPVSLAEFTLASSSGQTFYDISLVDGYNLPLAIISLYPQSNNASLTLIPPNLTNPVCIGTAALLAEAGSLADANLGTNASFPLPLDQSQSNAYVQRWCPWDLQLAPPTGPGDGVYRFPDDTIQRPQFNPCFSACAKYGQPADCCTGGFDDPRVCRPSLYSSEAKNVCPDAYSFAFDDQTSTFIIPSGGGFEVIFCPPGRSTNILTTMGPQLRQLATTGHVTAQLMADTQNATLISVQQNVAGFSIPGTWSFAVAFVVVVLLQAFIAGFW